jgi:hypothetical protein
MRRSAPAPVVPEKEPLEASLSMRTLLAGALSFSWHRRIPSPTYSGSLWHLLRRVPVEACLSQVRL